MTRVRRVWTVVAWLLRLGVRTLLVCVLLIGVMAALIGRVWGGPR